MPCCTAPTSHLTRACCCRLCRHLCPTPRFGTGPRAGLASWSAWRRPQEGSGAGKAFGTPCFLMPCSTPVLHPGLAPMPSSPTRKHGQLKISMLWSIAVHGSTAARCRLLLWAMLVQEGASSARRLGGGGGGGGNPLMFWRRGGRAQQQQPQQGSSREEEGAQQTGPAPSPPMGHGGALDDVDDLMNELAEQQVRGGRSPAMHIASAGV